MDEIVIGFLEEVEGYLPDMRRNLQTLKQESGNRQALAELHRITHTIKGAAAMVGLDDLSGIGDLLEKVMEHVLASTLLMGDELIYLLGEATQRIDTYCTMRRVGEPDDGGLYLETQEAFQATFDALQTETKENAPEQSPVEYEDLSEILPEQKVEHLVTPQTDQQAAAPSPSNASGVSKEDNSDSMADLLGQLLSDNVADEDEDGAEAVINDSDDDNLFPDFDDSEDDEVLLFDEVTEETQELEKNSNDLFEIDLDLLQCFHYESEEQLESIDTQLSSLIAVVAGDPSGQTKLTGSCQESLHSIRRSVHTLKGAAAVIGIEQIAAWGHDFEDFLDWLCDESPIISSEAVAVMQDGADLLAKLADEPAGQVENERQDLVARFTQITEAVATGVSEAEKAKKELSAAPAELDPASFPTDEQPTLNPSPQSEPPSPAASDPVDTMADFFAEENAEDQADETVGSLFDQLPGTINEPDTAAEDLFQDVDDDGLFAVQETGVTDQIVEPESPPEIIQEIYDIDPELLQCFHEEAEEHLDNIDRKLNHFATVITDRVGLSGAHRNTLHSIRRSVHTLKGAAAVIGIKPIAAWGHDFEDFLDWLHDDSSALSPEIVAAMLDGTDLLIRLAEDPTGSIDEEKKAVTELFREITEAAAPDSIMLLPDDAELVDLEGLEELDASDALYASSGDTVARPDKTMVAMADLFADGEEASDDDPAESFFDELSVADDDASDSVADDLFAFPEAAESEFPEAVTSSGLDAIDPELLECFHEETKEHLENIGKKLDHFSSVITEQIELSASDRDALHSLRRSVHTLKGAAAVIGVEQVAAWGYVFEDFLDWLHDEGRILTPETVEVMRKGEDILVRLVDEPTSSVEAEQNAVTAKFNKITVAKITEPAQAVTEPTEQAETVQEAVAVETAILESVAAESESSGTPSTDQTGDLAFPAVPVQKQSGGKKTATLRVDVGKVDQMVGLSGDMVINLSSFEDSMSAASGTMKEQDMILQRLKNINYSLEAGYELASIPHLGSMTDSDRTDITEDFDPLEMDRYSELNILIRSLSEAVSDLESIMAQSAVDNVTWQKTVERQSLVLKEIQNRMVNIRMTPLSVLSGRMRRTVREAARTTGHPARLTITGETIMMDTRVWDVMADPLMHILRNSVAHGGRSTQVGQTPLSVRIRAVRQGGQFTLKVSDDGKGLDYEAIRIKGMKLYPSDRINLMSDKELAGLIFRHGFSSTASVTNIAGRGVGMDVVRDAVDQLNGSIEIISERGQGLELIMRLPVSVAQLPAILARFGRQMYAVPLHDVQSVLRASPEEKSGNEYTFDGEVLPLVQPAAIPGFQTKMRRYSAEHFSEEDQALLVIHVGGKKAVLLCDQLFGQRDIVFKDLGTHLRNVPCISGVTIMGDGSLIPILHVEEFLRKWTTNTASDAEAALMRSMEEDRPLQVLVVDDSISVRKVVSNVITQQGWLPVTARNGIEALERIREEKPDFVLLDVEMPRMNGFEVLQALQAQSDLRDIPVAMLTSRSADKYKEKATQLGARGFMNKPFKADEVVTLIRSMTAH